MTVRRSFRENSGRRVFEIALFLIFLFTILSASGCAGVVSGNGETSNQPTPQEAVKITSVQATAPTPSGFQVGWLTNVLADSQIDFGTSSAYGSSTPLNSTTVTVHRLTLSGLATGTLYHYRVRSTDAKNNQAMSSDFTFATAGDTTSPTVSITSPTAGASLSGTSNVVASAEDNVSVASVQFKVDGANSGPSLTSPPYAYSLNTNSLSNGNHTLVATATDQAGNTATSAGVPFVVSNSRTLPPAVSITAPTNGATVSGTVAVTANATSSLGVASVQFQLDGANVGSAVAAAPYTYSWDTTRSSNGIHTLKAVAKDTAGNSTTSAGDAVTVSNAVAPPAVSITAPGNGATVSGTVAVTANATSSLGVASVQFQLDGANVGSAVTAAPYTYSWDTTRSSNGIHTLKAVAKDTAGNSTTSAGDAVTVSNAVAPPAVSITAPGNGATVSGTVAVTANATSSLGVASVQFQLDGANVGSAVAAAPYTYSWDTTRSSNGIHTLKAVAKDTAGNSTTSAGDAVTVSNAVAPPAVSITAPANGATVSGTVAVTANATSSLGVASVQFQLDGANVGSAVAAAPYTYSWDTTRSSNGIHTLKAVAKDTAGNSTTSAGDAVTVSNAVAPPAVSITAPGNGATVSGTVAVTANATSSLGVASVQFQLDGANVGSAVAAAPYTYSWDTTRSSNGIHTLKAVAKDTAGNSTTSAGDTVTVSNAVAPPAVSITAPGNGATVSGTVAVTANATSSLGVASVQFQLDGANVGSAVTAAPYTYSWDTTRSSNGIHTLKAVAKDTAGNSTTSAGDAVTVSNAVAPPAVSITAPGNGATVSGTVAVTANATSSLGVASVQFQLDGANVGSAVAAAPYTYSWDTTRSSNGIHTLKAVAKDTAGNSTTSAGDTVTVSNAVAPPVVSIISPVSGATVSGIITVSGTASSSLAVSLVQVSVDGGSFSNASGTNSWSFSLDTDSLSNAAHTLTAKVTDSSGSAALSNSLSVTVNNIGGPTVTINWSDVHQEIDGFGASSAATGDGISNSQADLFWSTTNGVGLSLLRVQIESNGTYPDLATMQKAQDRGVRIWGTPWSPPASMKTNGSTTNGGSLLASDYQAYANYLSTYVLTLKNSYGFDLYAISLQNEPNYVASWDSCIWTGQQFHDFLANNLLPTFARNGVTTKIMMPEETGWFFDLATATLNDPNTATGISIIAAHNYDGAQASPYPLGQNQGKRLWETEVSSFEAFDPSITNGLIWAQKINDWMTIANANAWHYWDLLSGGASDNGALLGPSEQPTKRLYVMGNFSKFVRPGYYRIGTTASPVSGVSVSAYKDPNTGKFAIVAINHNASAVTLDFALNGFTANSVAPWVTSSSLDLAQQPSISVGGSAFGATLPAASVTTFVGP